MDQIVTFVKEHRKEILFFIFIYIILFINSVHERYPDEMDNILGGYLINHGRLPYTGFFTHHGPLAYYLASFLTFFSKQSFVRFRFISTIFYLTLLIVSFIVIKKRVKESHSHFFFSYIAVLALSSTFFWAHMFLADPISGYLIIPAYGLLFLKMFKEEALKRIDLAIISVFSSLAVINSPTYFYSVAILVFFSFLYFLFRQKGFYFNTLVKKVITFIGIFAVPYILFFFFLIVTSSLPDYYFQALVYNKNYYIYNYPRPAGSFFFNPVRYAIIIIDSFINAYQVLFAGIKNVDFINPFNVTLALSNLVLWLFLFVKKKYFLLTLSLLVTLFVNVRSNPLNVKATDYQAAAYIMLSFFNAAFILYVLKDEIKSIQGYLSKILLSMLSILLIIYWFFNIIFIFGELWRMTYLRYMGRLPLIYDAPQVARIVNDIVPRTSYCWVGPFEFEEMLYLDCKLPSRLHIFRRFFTEISSFKREILDDYSRNRADVIVYKRGVFAHGQEDKFFTEFLDKNYTTLKNFLYRGKQYQFKTSRTLNYILDEDFNFEKTKAERLIGKLIDKGYLEKGSIRR